MQSSCSYNSSIIYIVYRRNGNTASGPTTPVTHFIALHPSTPATARAADKTCLSRSVPDPSPAHTQPTTVAQRETTATTGAKTTAAHSAASGQAPDSSTSTGGWGRAFSFCHAGRRTRSRRRARRHLVQRRFQSPRRSRRSLRRGCYWVWVLVWTSHRWECLREGGTGWWRAMLGEARGRSRRLRCRSWRSRRRRRRSRPRRLLLCCR